MKYSKFGDLLEQDEFNAVSFYSKFGITGPPTIVNSHDVTSILHKLNIVYFYSLCRYLMNNLSKEYPNEYYAEISSEKYNLVMRGASYEKSMTSMHLNDIKQDCIDFNVNIHQIVDLFHVLTNKTIYTYELRHETEYDKFCHTLFPNSFEILDDFSGIKLQFVEEDSYVEEDSSVMDTSMTKTFEDSYLGDGEEREIISHSFNYDALNTVCEDKTPESNVFQQYLNLAFNEHKSLENKYTILQEKNYVLLHENNHLNMCLNEGKEENVNLKEENVNLKEENVNLKEEIDNLKEEIDNLKKEYANLNEDKLKKEIKLKEFVSGLGIL